MAEQIVFDLGPKTKICGDCKQSKPVSEFNKHYGKPRSHCKKCHSAYSGKWNKRNAVDRSAYVAEWHSANKATVREHKRKHQANLSPEKVAQQKERVSWWHVKRKYGLTREMWDEMFKKQGGLCALCRKRSMGKGGGRLDVDHCHETGRVRGLLCRHCNTALGILGDNPERMETVMDDLRDTPKP